MAGELLKPGVEVIQTIRKPAPSFVRPTLAPCVVGPAFEVLNVLNTDGTINAKALFGPYAQMAKAVTESSFPDPRGNIDELDVLEASVRPFLLYGGTLKELVRSPGQGFLSTLHVAQKPAFRTAVFGGGGLDLKGLSLTFALDQVLPLDPTKYVTVTFVGTGNAHTGNLTAKDAAAQINAAVGQNVATVVGGAVQLASPSYGALSSITVIAGGTANATLALATAASERIEGSGLRAQDPKNGTTQSQWVEFFAGAYKALVGQVWTAGAFSANAFLVSVDGVATNGAHPGVTFTGANSTVPLAVGDHVYCDGLRLKGGEVMKVEASRFKVGTINSALSTVDDSGQYLSKVYDVQTLGTQYDGSPFAPVYTFFVANGLTKDARPVPARLDGGVEGTAATVAEVQSTQDVPGPFVITGMTLRLDVTVDGITTEQAYTFTESPASLADLVTLLTGKFAGVIPVATGQSGFVLGLRSSKTGRLQGVTVKSSSTQGVLDALHLTADAPATGKDIEFAGLAGKDLQFKFDGNPHVYNVVFSSDSLEVAIEEINTVVGFNVAGHNPDDDLLLRLTSPLAGVASKVTVVANTNVGDDAAPILGVDSVNAGYSDGSGRPYPDAYLDDASVLHVNSQILRDPVTGAPLDFVGGAGQLYVQYKALRKDVSAAAATPGVVKLSNVDTLSSVLNPITEENPLGLGLFLAMINAPTFEVKGLGVDEVTPAAPEGTSAAWARAAGLLEAEEVYAIAPLTQDETVISLFGTHVGVMSAPEQGGERIAFVNKVMPTRKNPKIAVSGSKANGTGESNELMLDASPAAGLLAAGLNPGLPFTVAQGVYVEVEVAGELRRYNVSQATGLKLVLNTDFAAGENTDGFFTTTALTVAVTDSPYSVMVRGASLVIPGSNPARLDYQTLAETVAEANAGYKNRRLFSVFPDTVKATIAGVEKALPGYYACAAIAGMVAAQPPQQGFTNFPVTGLTGVVGPEKFTKRQLNIMAGGGTYILAQDIPGGAVYCRHQVSTDLTSIETRELSITKVVDFTAKMLRLGVRKFIGTNNVTNDLLDTLSATVFAIMKFLEATGVLNGFEVNNIAQDKDSPDTVLIDVTLDVPFPCNYIRLTLVV